MDAQFFNTIDKYTQSKSYETIELNTYLSNPK